MESGKPWMHRKGDRRKAPSPPGRRDVLPGRPRLPCPAGKAGGPEDQDVGVGGRPSCAGSRRSPTPHCDLLTANRRKGTKERLAD